MELFSLPPEVLREIIDCVGPSFFREDLGRFTVCKQWFQFACLTSFKSITLSSETLRALVSSGTPESQSLIESALKTLSLELTGHPSSTSTSPSSEDVRPNTTGGDDLTEDLHWLAALIERSSRLRELRIEARRSLEPQPSSGIPEGYLSIHTMQALLCADNISTLVIDLSAGTLENSSNEQSGINHLCPLISAFLPTLRTLHVRMPRVCSELLKCPATEKVPRLTTVVVNLSLNIIQPGITSASHSKSCYSSGGSLLQLKEDITTQAETLATQVKSIKILRVLTHSLPTFKIESLDVLTGKTMRLKDGMAWDDDGTVIEESEPESEFSSDDDFSAF
ncbi:hypothetical protein B0I35DRAFT_198945 [Stachybotrys elegans]|uniref:F-box domain-containing protein n=1 Tax=Stachybotrys elegans TaxID=80388 RepID=A0A8K0WRY2_9HYPO|nr:hypothetical protein B0I35DRAFT_198945 [Stachybotrys elegans]